MVKRERLGVILSESRLPELIASLTETYRIFGPSKKDDGESFADIHKSEELALDYANTKMSPKGFFFPQTESLMWYDSADKKAKQDKPEVQPTLLFGLRPCDALAISYLDKVFLNNEPQDPYYRQRREATKIVCLACNSPSPTCFCTSVGCGPDSEKGVDIMMYKLNDRYLMKALTPGGEEILTNINAETKPATSQDIVEKDDLVNKACQMVKRFVDIDKFKEKLNNFQGPWWEKLAQKCLGCGICTYFCPTCHCFDVTDEVVKQSGRRVRTWDSCMYPLFTLHASGYNPRPGMKERMRQRIMHKFNYAVEYYGETFCVGCGRCIIHCPVNIDIRQIIMDIAEER